MGTIFALASARGKAGIAVVRVSGPRAHAAVAALCGDVPPPRVASLRRLTDRDGRHLDTALVLTFARGASFTGEDSAELHLHGSPAIVAAILWELGSLDGLSLAEPGAFTRRALENGRMDLTEVEGLADLIEAETEAQRRQALHILSGAASEKASQWRASLVRAMALLTVTIDFADEDVPESLSAEVADLLRPVHGGFLTELAGARAAERVRDGFEVAIVGRPNVGKSTLLNRLAGREAAITSDVAGTTRDVIEVRMDVAGLAVTFLDTAGLRDTTDAVEAIGVSRARARAEAADLRIYLVEGDDNLDPVPRLEDIILRAKADLRDDAVDAVSGLTGHGVSGLLASVESVLSQRVANAGIVVRERHRRALERACEDLAAALDALEGEYGGEIVSEHLRGAVQALDAWIGHVDIDEVLDDIFRSFCIGK